MADDTELERFYQALSGLARVWQLRDRECRRVDGMTVAECYALEAVVHAPDCTVNDVARELGIDKSGASRAVEGLEAAGLVTRVQHPAEHRAWQIRATRQGRSLHQRVIRQAMHDYSEALALVPPERRREFTSLLERLGDVARREKRG